MLEVPSPLLSFDKPECYRYRGTASWTTDPIQELFIIIRIIFFNWAVISFQFHFDTKIRYSIDQRLIMRIWGVFMNVEVSPTNPLAQSGGLFNLIIINFDILIITKFAVTFNTDTIYWKLFKGCEKYLSRSIKILV